MSHGLLADANFYALLLRFDADIGERARAEGCECGGRLDRADYPRKPRGGPQDLGAAYARRISLCCAREGCRARTTPPSVRFLGRRVYLGAVVLLVSAMRHGVTPARARELRARYGVSRWTLARWREWWLAAFTVLPFWRLARSRFAPPVDPSRLPASVVERFGESGDANAIAHVLAFLAPITTASCVMEARIPMDA